MYAKVTDNTARLHQYRETLINKINNREYKDSISSLLYKIISR